MDATDSSRQGNKTGSIRHWWGQSVRSASGVGTGSGSDAVRDDGVRVDGVRSGRSVEHEARPPGCGIRNAVSGRPSREPPGRPAPSSPRCAFCTRGVHFALENDGWNCTFECEVHVSASGAPGGRRRDPCCPSRGPQRRRLFKSVAKSRIEPERRKVIRGVVLKAWGVKVAVAVCSGGSSSSGGLLRRHSSASPRFASIAHLAWWDGVSHVVTPVREIVTRPARTYL